MGTRHHSRHSRFHCISIHYSGFTALYLFPILENSILILLGVSPRCWGRRPVASPRAQAVGRKAAKRATSSLFAAASPAASALAGFPPKRLTHFYLFYYFHATNAVTICLFPIYLSSSTVVPAREGFKYRFR